MAQNRGRMNKTLPERVEIPFDRRAQSLVFLHTLSRKPGQQYIRKAELSGYYFIVYDDETFATLDIQYNINVANWDGLHTNWDYAPQGYALKRAKHVWRGQTRAGVNADLYAAEWVNPRPELKIQTIILASPLLYLPVLATQLWPDTKWLQKIQPYLQQDNAWHMAIFFDLLRLHHLLHVLLRGDHVQPH